MDPSFVFVILSICHGLISYKFFKIFFQIFGLSTLSDNLQYHIHILN